MVELYADKKRPERGNVDLHGFHPHDADLSKAIEDGIRRASEAGFATLTIIHGHGHNRNLGMRRAFVNSNTGWLGRAVREILRSDPDLRQWMFAKFDCSHDGSTTVRLRTPA